MANPQEVRIGITSEDLSGPGFASATAKAQAFQSAVGAGLTGSMKEARGAAALLGEEVGVRLSRHLQTALVSSEALRGVLAGLFPFAAALGFAEVAMHLGEQLKNAFDVISGIKAEDAMIEANAKLEESLHRIAEKTAEAAAAYERLGKSAQQVAIMDMADAAAKQQSAQLQLSNLRGLLAAQEALANQTERTGGGGSFRGGAPVTYQPTGAALAAQELIPGLKDQIATLENSMTLLQIGVDSAGKHLDDSLTAAFEKASERAERLKKTLADLISEMDRMGSSGWSKASIARSGLGGFPLTAGTDEMSAVATPSDAGAKQHLQNLIDQRGYYEETRTAAEQYTITVTNLNAIFENDKSSEVYKRALDDIKARYDAATVAANKAAKESAEAWKQFDSEVLKNVENAAFMKESWHKALQNILEDLANLIIKLEIIIPLQKAMAGGGGGGIGGFFSSLFGSGGGGASVGAEDGGDSLGAMLDMGGGLASGGSVSAGMSYLVGERGPELFTSGRSGAITPNHALGGHTVYNIDARGADASVEQRIRRMLPLVEERAVQRSISAVNERNLRR